MATAPRPRLWRMALIGVGLLLLGFVVSVGVAWAAAVWARGPESSQYLVCERDGAQLRAMRGTTWVREQWTVGGWPKRFDEVAGRMPSWVWGAGAGEDAVVTEAYGFPMKCLATVRVYAVSSSTPITKLVGCLALTRGLRLAAPGPGPVWPEYVLPTMRVWGALMLDAVFWGVVCGVVWKGPGVVVREIRRRRVGMCRGCGYDRRGLAEGAVCPECGRG